MPAAALALVLTAAVLHSGWNALTKRARDGFAFLWLALALASLLFAPVTLWTLPPGGVKYEYTGGGRGWKGDVPVVRIATDRIRALGWSNRYSSAEALQASMRSMLAEANAGRLW